MGVQYGSQASKQYATIPYSQFETPLDHDKIDKLWIEQNTIKGALKKPEKDGLTSQPESLPTLRPGLTNIT